MKLIIFVIRLEILCDWLTPCPEHSRSSFIGHFVWSMYGKRLTHVWFTQIKFLPQGVPSRTKPCWVYSGDVVVPLVVLTTKSSSYLIGLPIEVQKCLYFNFFHDLLALVFDSFDWYDCFGAHLIRTRRTWWMTVTIFALQCATFHIPTESEVSKN